MDLASIPSPADGVWHLGPLPVRGYALCIIAGIFAGRLGRRPALGGARRPARGRRASRDLDGALRDRRRPDLPRAHLRRRPTSATAANRSRRSTSGRAGSASGARSRFGGVGAWIGCRRRGIPLPAFADALAPGIVARPGRRPARATGSTRSSTAGPPTCRGGSRSTAPTGRTTTLDLRRYHPTFLYELLWNVGVAGLVIWADRRFRLGHGRAFALYVVAYTVGRGWIEDLRIDPANELLGLRLNEWTSRGLPRGGRPTSSSRPGCAPAARRRRSSKPTATRPDGPAVPTAPARRRPPPTRK